MDEPDSKTRPYSTIWQLKDLRDSISHAKPEKFTLTIDHADDEEPDLFYRKLDEVVTHENAKFAKEDIELIIEGIHDIAKNKDKSKKDIWFGDRALKGPFQYSSGHTFKKT
jgi:hypothetical protein